MPCPCVTSRCVVMADRHIGNACQVRCMGGGFVAIQRRLGGNRYGLPRAAPRNEEWGVCRSAQRRPFNRYRPSCAVSRNERKKPPAREVLEALQGGPGTAWAGNESMIASPLRARRFGGACQRQ